MRKRARRQSRLTKIVLSIFLPILAIVLTVGKATFDFTHHRLSTLDYSDVIVRGVEDRNPRVVDIAMLGAHDAFSHLIHHRSIIDPAEAQGSILRNPVAKVLANGLFVRLAKAQLDGPEKMLHLGVRYLDVRLSDVEGTWYTKHGLLSAPLSLYLDEIIPFLSSHPGEFIIFDMQHIYFDTLDFSDLWTYLNTYKVEGVSLLDFVHINTFTSPLSTLTYHDVTMDGQDAGVVFLAKTPVTATNNLHYERGNGDGDNVVSIRSVWHETSDTNTMFSGILSEVEAISSTNTYDDIFRVNQAQKTGKISGSDIIDTLLGWSLVDLARVFNQKLVAHDEFASWLESMPIVMVDYATGSQGDFNETINEIILDYNQSLL